MAKSPIERALLPLYRSLHDVGAIFSRLGTSQDSIEPPTNGNTATQEADSAGTSFAEYNPSPTLADILAAASLSTARARTTVFVLIGASIIAFAAAWKALPFGWFHARITATVAAMDYLEVQQAEEDKKEHKNWFPNLFGIGVNPAVREKTLKANRLETLQLTTDAEWDKHIAQGKDVVVAKQFVDAEHARAYLSALEQARIESVNVLHIPIFGITFDVNDLGIISGLSFVVLLITLRLGLSRELQNLRMAFIAARRLGRLKEAYKYLSMSQVMTLPPFPRSRPTRQTLWGRAPMLLIWAPWVVQMMIFAADFATMHIGQVTSIGLTNVALLMGFASVFVILILSFLCWHLSGEIDHEWLQAWTSVWGSRLDHIESCSRPAKQGGT